MIIDKLNDWIKRTVNEEGDSSAKSPGPKKEHPKNNLFKKPQNHRDKKGVFHKSERNRPMHKNSGPVAAGTAAPHGSKPGPEHKKASVGTQKDKPFQSRRRGFFQRKATPQVAKAPKAKVPYIHPKVLRVIPIGGLNQVGQNMMIFEYEEDIIIIDMGFQFPEADMFGVDYVIPDISYLEDRVKKIKGVIITHGHLDHTGALPYLLPKLNYPPIYATKLTLGLIEERLSEFNIKAKAKLVPFDPSETLHFGKIKTTFFRVAHSIPDGVGVVIDTPEGKLVHTGDFKFDDRLAEEQSNTIYGGQEVNKMEYLGSQNVVALFSDSTNALKPGHTMSEVDVGNALEEVIKNTEGRLIIACFSSMIGRMQKIMEYAEKYDRKVFVNGRSMLNTMDIALKLGYMKFKRGLVHPIRKEKDIPPQNCLILTTGSQGEAVSALARMAANEHKFIKIHPNDTVILSSKPIPGNETAVTRLINKLCLLGANVIHNMIMDVHASGHGSQEDLKRMVTLIKPKYLVPAHGEYFMRVAHARLGEELGMPKENCVVVQNGDVLEVRNGDMKVSSEKVETKYILIDGKGIGDEGAQVMTDRQLMSENGILIILLHINKKTRVLKGTPDVISRGFMYQKETDKIAHEFMLRAGQAYKNVMSKNPNATRREIKNYITQSVNQLAVQQLDRSPVILPVIIES